jgi:hypothetical protein
MEQHRIQSRIGGRLGTLDVDAESDHAPPADDCETGRAGDADGERKGPTPVCQGRDAVVRRTAAGAAMGHRQFRWTMTEGLTDRSDEHGMSVASGGVRAAGRVRRVRRDDRDVGRRHHRPHG